MTPMSPVLPTQPQFVEVIFAEDQPEYQALPAVRLDNPYGEVVSRWKLNWRERLRVLWTGNLWLDQMTFGRKLQPILPTVQEPSVTTLLDGEQPRW